MAGAGFLVLLLEQEDFAEKPETYPGLSENRASTKRHHPKPDRRLARGRFYRSWLERGGFERKHGTSPTFNFVMRSENRFL